MISAAMRPSFSAPTAELPQKFGHCKRVKKKKDCVVITIFLWLYSKSFVCELVVRNQVNQGHSDPIVFLSC